MRNIELVINIDKDIAEGIINGENDAPRNIVRAFQALIADAIKNGKVIPEGAINGDVIKAMFPNLKVEDNGGSIYLHYFDGGWIVFDRDWWDAPYKKGVEE